MISKREQDFMDIHGEKDSSTLKRFYKSAITVFKEAWKQGLGIPACNLEEKKNKPLTESILSLIGSRSLS